MRQLLYRAPRPTLFRRSILQRLVGLAVFSMQSGSNTRDGEASADLGLSTIVQMRRVRTARVAGLATVALLLGLGGCTSTLQRVAEHPSPITVESDVPVTTASEAPSPQVASTLASPAAEGQLATFVAVVDGDTVQTSEGVVRIIGIDSPERGECGHEEATRAIEDLLSPGDQVLLVLPLGQNDRDKYERLIRFVVTAEGVDLALMQLEAGNAIARYDSTDGYPEHPYQAAYHAAQIASLGPDGSVITVACQGKDEDGAGSSTGGDAGDPWWLEYSSCTKLKKNTVGHPTGPFNRDNTEEAAIYEWFAYGTGHRGDGDGDGLACE